MLGYAPSRHIDGVDAACRHLRPLSSSVRREPAKTTSYHARGKLPEADVAVGAVGGALRARDPRNVFLRPSRRRRKTPMAERVGFEPTVPFGYNGFRDRPIQPLSHLSARSGRGRDSL